MPQRILTLILLTGLAFGLAVLCGAATGWRLPDNQQGYSPAQPVAYSHRLHAGELGIECRFCHTGAEQGRHAGIPSADICMKCHRHVTCSFDVLSAELKAADKEKRTPATIVSEDLRAFYMALGLDDPKTANAEPSAGIAWVRVHDLPDYVAFDHRAHVAAGVTCQKCHGPVESMERVRQDQTLSMGWCVQCHREATEKGINGKAVHASTDCSTCHY